jgi:predicted glycosyltransferase
MNSLEKNKQIWIDLDNSPHVPFFYPIIEELKKLNYEVMVTARDCSQTCGLADLFSMKYRRIGRHYGKSKMVKVAGTVFRGLQLAGIMGGQKPQLAVSHGSRAQMLSAYMMGVPTLVIMDYEHVEGFVRPSWIMMPEVIKDESVKFDKRRIIHYPGIKEDVYVPYFEPDSAILNNLGLNTGEIVVTIRPPATEAHYHNPEAEGLFSASVNRIGHMEKVQMVILPRYEEQKEIIRSSWPELFQSKKIIIPETVVDGLNLLWNSDLVISGGGTMNREAAALGVPVYSIFRGKIGAVDRWLTDQGRLVLIETVEDAQNKIKVEKRKIKPTPDGKPSKALSAIIDHIEDIINSKA